MHWWQRARRRVNAPYPNPVDCWAKSWVSRRTRTKNLRRSSLKGCKQGGLHLSNRRRTTHLEPSTTRPQNPNRQRSPCTRCATGYTLSSYGVATELHAFPSTTIETINAIRTPNAINHQTIFFPDEGVGKSMISGLPPRIRSLLRPRAGWDEPISTPIELPNT